MAHGSTVATGLRDKLLTNLVAGMRAKYGGGSPSRQIDSISSVMAMRRRGQSAAYRPEEITAIAARELFGKPLVMNVYRSVIVEAMLSVALFEGWSWCSEDWAAFDFKHDDGTRLEVKQSAARQSWPNSRPGRPSFDIAARRGRWEKTNWRAEPGRNAELYVFAYHGDTSEGADHRNPRQWQFQLVPASLLPAQKTISGGALTKLVAPIDISHIAGAVEGARLALRT